MASLLERMNISTDCSVGAIRSRNGPQSSAPYNRKSRPPKRDIDAPWTHDMYEAGSLSARISSKAGPPKISLTTITQRALQEATAATTGELSIKGASATSNANVVEVSGLLVGTSPEDVAAIFKRCGEITNSKLVRGGDDTRIRLTFKTPSGASSAVQKFNKQPADGKVLSVRLIGSTSSGTTLGGRLGGLDGLGLVRDEGSVDVLIDAEESVGSKMRSDTLRGDPRAQVLVAPPGADPADYVQTPSNRGGWLRRGQGGRGRGGRRGRRGGPGLEARMDTD